MKFDGFGNFEDFAKSCGYTYNCSGQGTGDPGCNDIPGGFQEVDPMLVAVIGELLGNIIAGNLPFNVQNVVGNWLTLVGQSILTFNAQQQYFQGGPGRYYNIKNLNVTNPFCPQQTAQTTNTSTSNCESKKSKGSETEINELKRVLASLQRQVSHLEKNIDDLSK